MFLLNSVQFEFHSRYGCSYVSVCTASLGVLQSPSSAELMSVGSVALTPFAMTLDRMQHVRCNRSWARSSVA